MKMVNEITSLDFKWLKKRGVGINKGVQFYESFMYYGVKYKLYDCVYMYNEDLQEPYIGKLTNIWEGLDKTKKVKVHWFFRLEDISKWLGETKTLENEILFATGEGRGLANVNPLEAIVGLCNVVCVSKDIRNPQPTDEQLKAADFVFYRTFDVQTSAILDKMEDKIGGLEIKYVFNREESDKIGAFLESISDTDLFERNTDLTESDKSHDRPLKKIKSDGKCVEPGFSGGFEKMTDMPSMKVGIVPVEKVENKEKNTISSGSDKLLNQPSMKFKCDDKKPPEGKCVELEVACDPKKFKKMSTKISTVDSKSKHEDKSPADVKNLKASGTSSTTEDRKVSDFLGSKKLKRTRDDGSFKAPDSKMKNASDLVALSKGKSEEAIEEKSGESKKELSMNKSLKASALSTDEGKKNTYREPVVSPRPNSPWEHRLKKAYDEGTAILLYNVDPDFDSGEVEDIIWHAFKVNCGAKILQRTSVSSPHYAQALIVLKTKEAAQRVLTKLDKECLMFSDGRKRFMPLVATPCPPISANRDCSFFGHLAVGKARFQYKRKDEAVSTSHSSQPNTIEYDMAMEWRLLQLQSVKRWEKLHEQQGLELENLKRKQDLLISPMLPSRKRYTLYSTTLKEPTG